MDQIFKWTFMLAAFAISLHFLLERYVEVETQKQVAAPTAQADIRARAETYPQYSDVDDPLPGRAVEIAAGRNGHFFLNARVNGATIPFLVDTGASSIALSYEAGLKAGFRLSPSDFTTPVNTANGRVNVAPVTIDSIRYESIRFYNVSAAVLPKGALGGASLLGNTFLSKLSEFRVQDGKLIMLP